MDNPEKSKKALDPKVANASLNSEIHAATKNQSSVTPEAYPAAEREAQTDVVAKIEPEKHKPGKSNS